MARLKSEIIVLVDTSSFHQDEALYDVIDQVKEAVSFQISRGAITNRKLVKLGVEPNIARVKWTYSFFDSTCATQQETFLRRPMQTLTYECWDLFEEDLRGAVKSYMPTSTDDVGYQERLQNTVSVMKQLKFCNWPKIKSNSVDSCCDNVNNVDHYNRTEKFIFVFTSVPKTFSGLVHLAAGINSCKSSISIAANCSPHDVQVCMVDVKFDSITLQDSCGKAALPCFWDELSDGEKKLPLVSLKVACVKKIMMVHKLLELRFPWMYGYSLRVPFGFGMGMKRLRQWDWSIPQQMTIPGTERRCLPVRRCFSEMHCLGNP